MYVCHSENSHCFLLGSVCHTERDRAMKEKKESVFQSMCSVECLHDDNRNIKSRRQNFLSSHLISAMSLTAATIKHSSISLPSLQRSSSHAFFLFSDLTILTSSISFDLYCTAETTETKIIKFSLLENETKANNKIKYILFINFLQ